MRPFQLVSGTLLVLAYFVACGPALPSTTPLGGEDEPFDAGSDAPTDAADASSDAPKPPKPAPRPKPKPAPADAAPPPAPSAPPPEPDAGAEEASAPVAACDDSKGPVPACSGLKRPGGACVGAIMAKVACPEFNKLLKPAVAGSLIGCMIQNSQTQAICDPLNVKDCAMKAIKLGCPKPEYKTTCEDILRSCTPQPEEADFFNQAVCESGLASLKDEHRAPFISCVKSECQLGRCFSRLVSGSGN